MAEMTEVIEKLHARRHVLTDRLQRVRADRRHEEGPLSADFEEQAVERENDEVLDGLDALERQERQEIDAAIGRVEAGGFGICEGCEEKIEASRLAVAPSARLCLNCAEAAEA
jgi:RNA polymerase-binding transcription factor DksA